MNWDNCRVHFSPNNPNTKEREEVTTDARAMALELAINYQRSGKLSKAEQIYRRILAKDKEHVDANYLLGLIELEKGKFSSAEKLLQKSRDNAPGNPLYHFYLGKALQGQNLLSEAEPNYRSAIRLNPDYIDARYTLAHLLQTTGRLDHAIAEYRELLKSDPSIAAAHNNLGNALCATGHLEEGLQSLRRAVELEPNYAQGWGNFGNALKAAGRLHDAKEAFEKSLRLAPDDPIQHYNFGNLQREMCDYAGAAESFETALRLKPDFAAACNNLGNLCKQLGRLKSAHAAFERAIGLEPDSADLWNNLGNVLVAEGDILPALDYYRKAIALSPDCVAAYTNLVYALNFPEGLREEDILAEHRGWSRRFEISVKEMPPLPPRPLQGRKLRIGYVSGDFRRHSVAFFFEPLLEAHDRNLFEIFCYANNRYTDEVTCRIMARSEGWRPIHDLNDEQAAELIRSDLIDVLVDLSGHTDGNRLLIFAHRPAPVQINWLGYPNSTGMERIDYRLVDAITDPPREADRLATETLYRLPGGFLCYRGDDQAPDVAPPPCLEKGYVTFGSFNNLTKVNREVVDLWAQLLLTVPNSRLVMKTNQLEDLNTCEKYYRYFGERGVTRERIDLRARTSGLAEHLAVYGEIDIALDTFPYNGTTTTCEALWMGVPVLALDGHCHRARVSKSILIHAGLAELVATDHEDLLTKVQAMLAVPETIFTRRGKMRQHLCSSQLCDQKRFAKAMEDAYLTLFKRALHNSRTIGTSQ